MYLVANFETLRHYITPIDFSSCVIIFKYIKILAIYVRIFLRGD
jgi:hypothetical protein